MKLVFILVTLLSIVAAAEDWLLQTVQRYEAAAARCPVTDDLLLWPQDANKPRAVFRTQLDELLSFEMSWEGLWDELFVEIGAHFCYSWKYGDLQALE